MKNCSRNIEVLQISNREELETKIIFHAKINNKVVVTATKNMGVFLPLIYTLIFSSAMVYKH